MKRVLRWTGAVLGGVIALAALAFAAVYGVSEVRLRRTYTVPAVALSLRDDSATIARGAHIAAIRGCLECHTGNLAGGEMRDAAVVGAIYASNLTSGKNGAASFYTDADWDRAIRHGVRPDGKPLIIMPAQEYTAMSDEDLAAVVAYLKSLPPVNTAHGPSRLGLLGRVLEVTGKGALIPAHHMDHTAPREPAPPAGPTAEYGAYLITTCTGCHRQDLTGGPIPGMPPGTPPARNLTPDEQTGLGRWTEADFARALREGKKPDGSEVRPPMPWRVTAHLTDDELHALWLHLRSLPAKPVGS